MTSGANPISFNKKNKGWTSRTLVNPPPAMSDNISFLSYLPLHPPPPTTTTTTTLKVDVICASPLLIPKLSHMCITPIDTKN